MSAEAVDAMTERERGLVNIEIAALRAGHRHMRDVFAVIDVILADHVDAHEAQIRDLLEEREELLTEIVRLPRGNHPAGRALPHLALAEALTERDAEHEGGGGT